MAKNKVRLIDANALLSVLEGYSKDDGVKFAISMVHEAPEIKFAFNHFDRLYEQITNPEDVAVYAQDYVSTLIILLNELPVALSSLKWREDKPEIAGGDSFLWLSLLDISKQIGMNNGIIDLIVEGPLDGVHYRYGNHGDSWEIVGRLCGYA